VGFDGFTALSWQTQIALNFIERKVPG